MNWQQLIDERNEWVAHNFPDTPSPDGSLLGVIEELGELAHAALKSEQNIRGTKQEHIDAAQDAIGDITVYLLGVMGYLESVPPFVYTAGTKVSPTWTLRYLAHDVGRMVLDPSVYFCERIVARLKEYCAYWGWDYEEIVMRTWNEVKLRDWIAHPDTGFPDPAREPDAYAQAKGVA